MKIGALVWTGTGVTVVVGTLVAAMFWWSYRQVDVASTERQQASEIARGLLQLRLLSFEYRLRHQEDTKREWLATSDRIDRSIAGARTSVREQAEIVARVRERRAVVRRLFAQLVANPAGEMELLEGVLARQQENLVDVFRLADVATARIGEAQYRLMVISLSGLALIVAIKIAASWFIQRGVLSPISALQHATQRIAAGHWTLPAGIRADNEVGDLWRSFDAMTASVKDSLARAELANRELVALNEELEAFSYSVSHDLRTPLRSMDGFSLVLLEDYDEVLDAEGKDALRRIRAASQRMGSLIDDLLRLAQVGRTELHVEAIDLSALAREISDAIGRAAPDRAIEWVIEPGLTLHVDPALGRIAMENLLRNAAKFSARAAHAVIRVGATERDGGIVFFVSDNGVGFDMAHAGRLFSPFQRMHRTEDFQGTGVGLAIVQRIIRRHGGKIWAEAKEGEGATFFFCVKAPEA